MAPHDPVDTFAVSSGPPDPDGRDDRFASARPAEPTIKGFTPWQLAASAVGLAFLAVSMWAILTALDEPGIGVLFLLPTLACAGATYAVSVRRRLRDGVIADLAESLAQHLGVPDASYLDIDARQWQGGWIGVPHVLNIQYPTEVDDSAPDWPGGVAEAVHQQLEHQYTIGRHNVRGHRVTLRDPTRTGGALTPEPSARVDRARDAARRALPDKVARPVPTQADLTSWLVPLGIDGTGTRVGWNLAAPQGHLLVLGRSGAGKRVLLTGIVVEAAARGWPVWIIDQRRVDLLGVRDWPNVQIVASTLDDQIVVLNQAWREMEGRVALIESGSSRSELEPLVVVIHHFREFATAVADAANRAGQGTAAASLAHDRVTDLLRHGRQVNVYVVLSMQRADDPLLRQENRDDIGAVVALGRLDSSVASVLWGSDRPTEPAEPVPGRATMQSGDAKPVLIQCYWTPDPREARRVNDEQDLYLLDALRPSVVTHPVLHVQRSRALADSPEASWRVNLNADLAEGYGAGTSGLADWSRARTSGGGSSAAASTQVETSGWSEMVMVSQLQAGSLARLDDETGWVIIEQVEPIQNDGTKLLIRWRGNDGAGSQVVSRTRAVRIRHLTDGIY
ncbi:FtsK/SpoIIIE domain-containing protein [Jiangella alkaliphila]|uniref:FtsK/SpoIIIE family protein n=1 Tax=Jiangella alkaliphila TaxID=419479 RepID=A0A1H2HL65_9ACTN|nr:FtsK/SpoIIIE domain-containing protein [Jiangella alkaliphila]SDU32583.1 FtsK/SpoIIIE family protein [Jiangella alkaliphila]